MSGNDEYFEDEISDLEKRDPPPPSPDPDYLRKVEQAVRALRACASLDPGILGHLLGAALLIGASDADTTPRALVARLVEGALPTDEAWLAGERDLTREAVRRARLLYTSQVVTRPKTTPQI